MWRIKKSILSFISLIPFLLLISCDLGPSELETAVYSLNAPLGTSDIITLDYDAKGNVQLLTQEILIIIPLSEHEQHYFEEIIIFEEKKYDRIHGAKYVAELSEQEFSQTLVLTIKDVTNLNLSTLFVDAYANGKISLDIFADFLVRSGFEESLL